MTNIYEENLKTCILLARASFFTVVADLDDDIQRELCEKIEKCQREVEHNQANNGLFGGRVDMKWYHHIFTPLAIKLGFTRMNPIYRIPGFYEFDNANPRKVYQKWCAAFDGVLDEDDIQLITTVAINNDDNFYEYALKTWENMEVQKKWSVCGELRNIFKIF